MTFTMRVVQGKPHGSILTFHEGEFVVGCGPECQVRLNSELISRQHCLLRVCGDAFLVRDLGSTYGTLVNGKLIVEECVLACGDTLQVGQLVLELGRPEVQQEGSAGGTVEGTDIPRRSLPVGTVRNCKRPPDTMERDPAAETMSDVADTGIQQPKTARNTVHDVPVLYVGTMEPAGSGIKNPEIKRLLATIAQKGVEAALTEIQDRQDLMEELAEKCYSAGLVSEAQYLDYLRNPQD